MGRIKLLGVGHSHIMAMKHASRSMETDDLSIATVNLRLPEFDDLTESGMHGPQAQRIRALASGADLVFLSLHGNQHNSITLVQSERPFGFSAVGTGVSADTDGRKSGLYIPVNVMLAVLREKLKATERQLCFFSELFSGFRIVHCESPPPNPDEDFIRKNPGVFSALLEKPGARIAPPLIRLMVWRLQSQVMKLLCDDLGIGYLPCPPETLDAAGFTRPEFWGNDPTHGNVLYGQHVIEQLLVFLASPSQEELLSAASN